MDTKRIDKWIETSKHLQGKHDQKLHGNRSQRLSNLKANPGFLVGEPPEKGASAAVRRGYQKRANQEAALDKTVRESVSHIMKTTPEIWERIKEESKKSPPYEVLHSVAKDVKAADLSGPYGEYLEHAVRLVYVYRLGNRMDELP